jgi:hypothetical protein
VCRKSSPDPPPGSTSEHTPTDSVRWLARLFVHLYGRDKIPGHNANVCDQCVLIDVAGPRLEAALWSLNLGPGGK